MELKKYNDSLILKSSPAEMLDLFLNAKHTADAILKNIDNSENAELFKKHYTQKNTTYNKILYELQILCNLDVSDI